MSGQYCGARHAVTAWVLGKRTVGGCRIPRSVGGGGNQCGSRAEEICEGQCVRWHEKSANVHALLKCR